MWSSGHSYSSRLFLRLLGIVYLCAFWSLGVQVRGLFGHAGILPITEFLADAARWISAQDPGASKLLALPTIFWFASSDARWSERASPVRLARLR
jgi:hypothetical protein